MVSTDSCFISTGRGNTLFRFVTTDMCFYLTGGRLEDALQKGYEAAATVSEGFAFSSSQNSLFNQPGSWQKLSSASLAFNSTFFSLLQRDDKDFKS